MPFPAFGAVRVAMKGREQADQRHSRRSGGETRMRPRGREDNGKPDPDLDKRQPDPGHSDVPPMTIIEMKDNGTSHRARPPRCAANRPTATMTSR